MGLTTALNTSLNGLTLNETAIEVIGNNIANAGTNGFKASKVLFQTQLSRTLSVGAAPDGDNQGLNPLQIGLGATTASVSRDFSQGAITTSTSPSDLAIEGAGFFILSGNAAGTAYSRNGNFDLSFQKNDSQGNGSSRSKLVNSDGLRVQGYGIDDDFNINTNDIGDIEIPLGRADVAQATTLVSIEGSLQTGNAATVATAAAVIDSDVLNDAASGNDLATAIAALPGGAADVLLTDVVRTTGDTLFTDGDTLELTPRKGGADYTVTTFDVTATSTLQDFLDFVEGSQGLFDDATIPDDPTYGPAGVSITGDGRIRVVSNIGSSQAVSITGARLLAKNGSSTSPVDLNFSETQSANGESAVVTFPVFDTLGEQVIVKMHAVLEERTPSSTTFRYYIESPQDSDDNMFLKSGTFAVGGDGVVTGDPTTNFTINRNDIAARDIDIEIDFSSISGLAQPGASSLLSLASQNGAPSGTLTSFNVSSSGVVNGIFSNGIIRPLGQILLATFPNALGLVENGNNTFIQGVNSGPPKPTAPGDQGTGTLRSGAIELSNTDVGRNLVELIVASTNYRGNARVISSTQQLVDELLVLGR